MSSCCMAEGLAIVQARQIFDGAAPASPLLQIQQM